MDGDESQLTLTISILKQKEKLFQELSSYLSVSTYKYNFPVETIIEVKKIKY
jgi:hypothetical protein